MTTEITDLEIYLGPSKAPQDPNGEISRHDVQARVNGSGLFRDEITLNHVELGKVADHPSQYGILLGSQVFSGPVSMALQKALAKTDRVRMRLSLDSDVDERHDVRWERMYVLIDNAHWPVASAPRLLFSRCLPENMDDQDPPPVAIFRLLLAISNPNDLAAEKCIDVNAEVLNLVGALSDFVGDRRLDLLVLPGRSGADLSDEARAAVKAFGGRILDGNSTLSIIGEFAKGCQIVHVIGHGNLVRGRGQLLLESGEGASRTVDDAALQDWVHRDLRLVFLQACRGAAKGALAGLAPKLLQFGVPAVVAMQDFVAMTDARDFTRSFYRSLIDDGVLDEAVNSGRRLLPNDSRSIPTVFLGIRNGRLWAPDPVRSVLRKQLDLLANLRNVRTPYPIEVIDNLKGLELDHARGAVGPRADLVDSLPKKLDEQRALVCLTGPPGTGKGGVLNWIYCQVATAFLKGGSTTIPIRLTLKELGSERFPSGAVVGASTRDLRRWSNPPELFNDEIIRDLFAGRSTLLLVDGNLAADAGEQQRGLQELTRFRAQTPNLRCLVTLDDSALDAWDDRHLPTSVLVVQPLRDKRVQAFLEIEKSTLWHRLEKARLTDMAGTVWMLDRLINFNEADSDPADFESRAKLLSGLVDDAMDNLAGSPVGRSVALQALSRIGWESQLNRSMQMKGEQLFEILADARGSREFPLALFRSALIDTTRVLVSNGEDGVRFAYPHMQSYFAARYLADCLDSQRHIEDITASLGRLIRVRWWEETVVILTSILGSPDQLLRAILAGSPLTEGEQVFLAVRCCLELQGRAQKPNQDLIEQILDTLIWRSSSERQRPYPDRRRAIVALGQMRSERAIPYLLSLACDPVKNATRKNGDEKEEDLKYEVSGIRLVAVNALRLLPEQVSAHVAKANRPDVGRVLEAWWKSSDSIQPLIDILRENNRAISPLAVFALVDTGTEEARAALAENFADLTLDRDVRWAIAVSVQRFDSQWVREKVIGGDERIWSGDHILTCYLIGKNGFAEAESPERKYLDWCLASAKPELIARGLRALADLRDESIRGLCETIVLCDWDSLRSSDRIKLPAGLSDSHIGSLEYAAIEALRSIGDAGSVAVLRKGRNTMRPFLAWLSYDVSEEIYWRVTGGLSNETFTAAGFNT